MVDRNLFLALALSLLVLTLWGYLQGDSPHLLASSPEVAQQAESPTSAPAEKRIEKTTTPSVPPSSVLPAPPKPPAARAEERPGAAEQTVEFENSLYHATLSSRGAELRRWELMQFFDAQKPGKPRIVLTTGEAEGPGSLGTPFRELGSGDWATAAFDVSRPAPDTVVFTRTLDGIGVRKTFVFDPSNYLVTLRIQITNGSSAPIEPAFETIWPEHSTTQQDFTEYSLIALQDGSLHKQLVTAAGSSGFFGKMLSKGPPTDPTYVGNVEWAGAQSRYFLAAMLPDLARDASTRFVTLVAGAAAQTALYFQPISIPPGQTVEREIRVYIGPKQGALLEATGSNLDRSIDLGYSWMTPLTRLFVWLLRALYALIPNYGVAIILLTILVRVVTAPLTARQMKSMKRMQGLQPRIKALQEKYADDRQQQSAEMMKIYKESGVNPLGGCLPILLQFPVFVGLYYALQSSIELRQAPFFGWIQDLSAPETLFTIPSIDLPVRLLPIIMGGSMVLQQKLSPQPGADPAQQRMMMTIMPVMFTVLFYQFPSGLVLYWLVSNLLASGHQYWLTRTPATAVEPVAPASRERNKR
jgi:YidC/Oxa1 family membrane protein insertase